MAVIDPTKGFDPPKFSKRIFDLTGQRFARLVVISFAGRTSKNLIVWNCLCDCGNTTLATSAVLRNKELRGRKRSCGCLGRDITIRRSTTHGATMTPTYKSWRSMKQRCCNPNATGYHRYGGRGISVCDRWAESFEAFVEDMGERPSLHYSLDRIDCDSDYTPDNCQWATATQQARNRTGKVGRQLTMTHQGQTKTLHEWADHLGIKVGTIYQRRMRYSTVEKILSDK